MGKQPIKVVGGSESAQVPVRRRNPQGSEIEQISASIPKELNKKLNSTIGKTGKSKSLVITELLTEAFELRERK